MTLDELPDGAPVLIDANILIYAHRNSSLQSVNLLLRCAEGSLKGFLTTGILSEACHRRMIQEAQSKSLVGSNPAKALSEKREIVRKLKHYQEEIRHLLASNLRVEPILPEDFHLALEFQQRFGLLTNDSLNLAVARRLSISDIATADKGLDSVQGFMVYKPSDLPASLAGM